MVEGRLKSCFSEILELQCRARHVLCRELQRNMACADVVKLFGHDVMRKFGFVAFAA